jgi:hypothetical protein
MKGLIPRTFSGKGKKVRAIRVACLVKWDTACRPKDLEGLGIHDLKCFGRALRQ